MNLHVDRHGGGRDLLLLHGWGLHSGVWRGVLPLLGARFRVHTLDLPGYGASRAVPARDFDEAVGLVAEALPADAIVCGWSLGGQLALALAQRTTRRVRALVLVSATPCFVRRRGWDDAMGTAAFEAFAAGLADDAEGTLARFIRLATLNGERGREAARALAAVLGEAPPADGESLRATLAWLRDNDLRADAERLRVPAVVLHGEADAVTPPDAGRWLASRIPDARFRGVPGCAHVPFLTHPAEFLGAIEAADG